MAIQLYQESLNKTPQDHPARASQLNDLGARYRGEHQRTGDTEDLDMAIQSYQESVNHFSSPVQARLSAATSLLTIHSGLKLGKERIKLAVRSSNWFRHSYHGLFDILISSIY